MGMDLVPRAGRVEYVESVAYIQSEALVLIQNVR